MARDMEKWRVFVNAVLGPQVSRQLDILSSWVTVSVSWGIVLCKVACVEVGLSLCEGSALKITERIARIVLVRCVTEEGILPAQSS
jgi:hypothetical protein